MMRVSVKQLFLGVYLILQDKIWHFGKYEQKSALNNKNRKNTL